jgi:serpin B
MSAAMHRTAAALACVWTVGQLIGCDISPLSPGAPAGSAGMLGIPVVAAGSNAVAGSGIPANAAGNTTAATPPVEDPSIELARSTLAADAAPNVSDSDYASFVSHMNGFGLDLGQAMAKDNALTEANIVYSPLSASYALAMTYAGAGGQTATELKTMLGDTFADGTFHAAFNRMARALATQVTSRVDSAGVMHSVQFNLADSIFVERTLMLRPAFLDLLAREYDSGARKLDFMGEPEASRATINTWVSEQTKNKINDLLVPGSVTIDTRIVLVNALYFYGSWQRSFEAQATAPAAFHPLAGASVQVPAMNGQFMLNYASSDDFAVADLPYEGGRLRMTIVLPASGKFEAVRSQLSGAWLEHALSGLAPALLAIQLPKFKMTVGSFSLKAGLESLGMKTAFTRQADFSGITSQAPLSIADVIQKAFINVDEGGTEAAAATAVVAGVLSAVVTPPTTPFIVDRPFLFFIRDAAGPVLFSGQMVDPSR